MTMTATERGRKRNAKAALVLSPIALDQEHAAKLAGVLQSTRETRAAWLRRMIRECYNRNILQGR